MHYRCRYHYTGHGQGCIAFSDDGVHWVRRPTAVPRKMRRSRACTDCPEILDPPNQVNCATDTESFTTWLDHRDQPDRRWKAVSRLHTTTAPMQIWSSADGAVWQPLEQDGQGHGKARTGVVTDRASFFFNPFRGRWAFSLRENLCSGGHGHMRIARYMEVPSLREAWWPNWVHSYFQCGKARVAEPVRWIGVDEWDCGGKSVVECDLYHVDASPYESLLVGQFAVLYPGFAHGGCKTSHIHVGFSRDGFHWSRPNAAEGAPRMPFVDDTLSLKYQQPIAGNMLVVGDEIYIYYGGATSCRRCNINPEGVSGKILPTAASMMAAAELKHGTKFCNQGSIERDGPISTANSSMDEVTALAVLRRDGFASLVPPPGHPEAHILTRMLTFKRGRFLHVNVDATTGELIVDIVPQESLVQLSSSRSVPLRRVNSTCAVISWRGANDDNLATLEGGLPFQLRFILRGASTRLYSFWISSDMAGHSRGYVEGPRFGAGRDVRNSIANCTPENAS